MGRSGRLLVDPGPFTDSIASALEISRSASSAYHTMSQGSVKRFNGAPKAYLSRVLKGGGREQMRHSPQKDRVRLQLLGAWSSLDLALRIPARISTSIPYRLERRRRTSRSTSSAERI